jgi:acetyl-CoA carboxylase biotin carboxyl carrier protein
MLTKEGGVLKNVFAIMAGNVWKILVHEGNKVEEGQDVVILESMKMEIPIASEFNGTVKEVKVSEGDFVNEGDVLLVLE